MRWSRICVAGLALLSCGLIGGAAQNAKADGTNVNTVQQARLVGAPTTAQQAEFARARTAAQEILSRAEFQPPQLTWWDRLKAKLSDWLGQLFEGIDRVTSSSPWLGRLLEWVLFLGAAVGLLVWVLRMVKRQRLRMTVGGAAQASTEWARESEDWRRLAEERAAGGAWREAIHALYWAAIVLLEQRRAWKHNPARTPREYVRLLRAGSEEQSELRGLTNALERTWYGQREARAEEYGEARGRFERLAGQPGGRASAGGRA